MMARGVISSFSRRRSSASPTSESEYNTLADATNELCFVTQMGLQEPSDSDVNHVMMYR